MKLTTAGLLGAALLGATSSAFAGSVYTTEADFLSAIQDGYYLEDFNDYYYGGFTEYTLDMAEGDWAYTISAYGEAMSSLWSGDGNMSTNSALDGLLVQFTGAPVTAVGGWFFPGDISGYYIPGPMHIELSDGTVYDFDPVDGEDFRGFTTDAPIESIWIEAPDAFGYAWPTMDHFYVGVPTPGVLALLGLAGLARSRRR